MVIFGTDLTTLEFNPPSAFGSLSDTNIGVFHPSGGDATCVEASANVMANSQPGPWFFNTNYEIENIGSSVTNDFEGNELVAFLPGLSKGVCEKINEELSISGVPVSSLSAGEEADMGINMDNNYTLPVSEHAISAANGLGALSGQHMGCFETSTADYVYYHVIAGR